MSRRVNNLIYAAGPDLANTIRIRVTLTEPADGKVLERALAKAAVRFPYFSVKLKQRGQGYVLEHNEAPFVASPAGKTVTLGTAESNFHLFAFAYDGCRLYLDCTHFMTDGNGVFPFLKTILYYYLSDLHPEEKFDTEGVAMAGDPVPDEEADDYPYPGEPLPEDPLGEITRPEEILTLADQPGGYQNADGWTVFLYNVKQKALMAYASGVDGSPATFIASLVFKAVKDCCPGNDLPVVCGMQHQFRKALGKPLSHMCHVNIVPIVYPDRLKDMDIELLNTIARGTLIIRADDANDVLTVNEHVRNEKLIESMDLAEKHAHMKKVVLDGIGRNTYEVSYTGRVSWSGLDRYVKDVVPFLDLTLSGGLSVEIFLVGDVFSISIMQRSGDPKYAERFSELLREKEIDFEAGAPEHYEICGFEFCNKEGE